MAYETLLTLKQMVANRRNKTNENTADTVRDNAIIDAIRLVYQEAQFSWLLKYEDVSITSGTGALSSSFNVQHGIETAYEVVSGIANDHVYTRVRPQDMDLYTTADYVYYITYSSGSFTITTNQTTSFTLRVWYYYQPAVPTTNTDITPIPDPWLIVWLATALWWSATEHEEDLLNNPFYPKYQERLTIAKASDRAHSGAHPSFQNKITELGDNSPSIRATRR